MGLLNFLPWNSENLDWEQGPIKILGVTFNWDINSQDILTKIEKKISTPGQRENLRLHYRKLLVYLFFQDTFFCYWIVDS